MSLKYYIILSVIGGCFCFSPNAFGQYIRKDAVEVTKKDGGKVKRTFAIIYSDGVAKSAQWDAGFNMMREIPGSTVKATVRHQVSKGNDGNPSVNDRIPFRFIVAPTDLSDATWMSATGVDASNNGNLNANFAVATQSGCGSYGAAGKPGEGRTWRLPTQRELQLMWMFRQPIGLIYPLTKDGSGNVTSEPMEASSEQKRYWASTEKDAGNAWFFDFKQGAPACFWQSKSTLGYGRCVSDY